MFFLQQILLNILLLQEVVPEVPATPAAVAAVVAEDLELEL
jgi:hypothetical protein